MPRAVAVLAVTAVCILIGTYLAGRLVVVPIKALTQASVAYREEGTEIEHHAFEELHIRTRDETELLADSMMRMEKGINEHIANLLTITQELASTREYASEMDYIASRDALTQVLNKRAYDIEAARANQLAQLDGQPFGIVMVDLNYLKQTNGTYGHERGDVALRGALEALGRDELLEPWERVSAAVGYARYDAATDDGIDSVFKRADEAMYACKKAMKAEREQ